VDTLLYPSRALVAKYLVGGGTCLEDKCYRQMNVYFMSNKLFWKFYIFQDNYTQQNEGPELSHNVYTS
jgi:hypothetical protein